MGMCLVNQGNVEKMFKSMRDSADAHCSTQWDASKTTGISIFALIVVAFDIFETPMRSDKGRKRRKQPLGPSFFSSVDQ